MTRIYCLGQVRAVSVNCYRCNHTIKEYLECPKFVENASHEEDISDESLEATLRKWVGRTGLEEEEE